MHIERATLGDLPDIHAGLEDETPEELRRDFFYRLILKAVDKGEVVGSVRGKMRGLTCHITRLNLRSHERQPEIASALMSAIEKAFPYAREFRSMKVGKYSE